MEYKAAILRAIGAPLSVETVHLQALGAGDVLVRILAIGLCHTDWEAAQGKFRAALPMILGHEGAGIVEDVGRDVQTVRRGDHVVCSPFPLCGSCYYCRRRQPMLCEPVAAAHQSGSLPGGQSRVTSDDGLPIGHFLAVSCYAEYAVVPERGAVVIPQEMPLDRACTLGCAVITGVGAALHVAGIVFGDTVCVIGCGPVGLSAIQGARLAGAGCIIAADTNAERLALARTFGAAVAVDPRTEDLVQIAKSHSGGRGVDCCFEAAGHESTLQCALDVTRPGGSITILSKMAPEKSVNLRFGSLMGDRIIRRSTLGGAQCQDDIPAFAKAYLDGRLLLDELITERIGLGEIDQGLERVGRGQTVRTVVMPHGVISA